MAKTTARTLDLEPIDRLEEKVKLLIGVIEQLRGEQTRLADENAKLTRELQSAEARMGELTQETSEVAALRSERDEVRTRVAGMLAELESLNL